MNKLYYVLLFTLIAQSGYAQWTQATNPEILRLGAGGVVSFNDTLYTGTALTSGFDDKPEAIYKSTDGLNWVKLVSDGSFNNQDLDLYRLAATDSALIISERRQVRFSKDGIAWELQSAITGQDDESTPQFFVQLGDVFVAGIKGDTNDGGDGVYRKEGDGEWTIANEGLPAGQDEDAVSTNNMIVSDGRIIVPTLEGLYISDDSAKTWSQTVDYNLTEAAAGNGMLMATSYASGSAHIYLSFDNGDTFSEAAVPDAMKSGVRALKYAGGYFFAAIGPNSGFFNLPDKGGVFATQDGEVWDYIGLMGTEINYLSTDGEYLFATVARSYTEAADEVGLWMIALDEVTTVSNEKMEDITGFILNQNYPNPFNPATNISYSLQSTGHVSLEVFNSIGLKVATLVDGVQGMGEHQVTFNAAGLPSGMYLYRIKVNGNTSIRKMTLLK